MTLRLSRLKIPRSLVVLSATWLTCAAVAGELTLQGDVLATAEVTTQPRGAKLAVFVADVGKRPKPRQVAWVSKTQAALRLERKEALPQDAAAFDICRLSPLDMADSVLLIRPQGIYRLGASDPLVASDTVFAHARDDAMPRVKVCFALFAGEGPSLLVPTLAGVEIYRSERGGFKLHSRLPQQAKPRFNWSQLSSNVTSSSQRVTIGLEFPEMSVVDFDHDGLLDLCANLGEELTCYLQTTHGFDPNRQRHFQIDLLTEAERKDTSMRVESDLVDINGDGRPDLVIEKINWNVTAMGTTVYVFLQSPDGGFSGKPRQTITRKGYFAYHDFLDLNADGLPELVAPVTPLGWSDLARIYLSKAADLDFVVYKNLGGAFSSEGVVLHSLRYPVEFKNLASLLGALPLWRTRVLSQEVGAEMQVMFFPGKEAIEIYSLKDGKLGSKLWRKNLPLGNAVLATDLDGDGRQELVLSYPGDPARAQALTLVEATAPL